MSTVGSADARGIDLDRDVDLDSNVDLSSLSISSAKPVTSSREYARLSMHVIRNSRNVSIAAPIAVTICCVS